MTAGRFFRRGVSRIFWLPAVSDGGPTTPDIDAGVELTDHIAELTGFEVATSSIAVPDLGSDFTAQIRGERTGTNPSITFYDDTSAADVKAIIAEGTAGWLLLAPHGLVGGDRADLWHLETGSVNDAWAVGAEAARFVATFVILASPSRDVTLP